MRFLYVQAFTMSHILAQGSTVVGILYLEHDEYAAISEMFCGWKWWNKNKNGAIFTLEIWEVFLFKLLFTVSFKCQSLVSKITKKERMKERVNAFCDNVTLEKRDLVERQKSERKTFKTAPPWVLRSGSIYLRRCLLLVNGWDSWSHPSRGVQVHE